MTRKKFIQKARDIALEVISAVEKDKHTADELLSDIFDRYQVPADEKSLASEIARGVIRRKLTLDSIIGRLSQTEFTKLHPLLIQILRVGLYQLTYLDRVPDYAAVNEAVGQARRRLHRGAANFCNALLRKFIASGKNIEFPEPAEDFAGYLSLRYSHPRWLAQRWIDYFGPEKTEAIFSANNSPPPIFIRTNRLKISPSGLMNQLVQEGITAQFCDEELGTLRLESPGKIASLAAFRLGYFYVQDLTAMRAAPLLSPCAGERILDLCSAPGGKATHAAELMENRGLIVAVDRKPEKMRRLQQNIARLGTSVILPVMADASRISTLFRPRSFDRIVADVPCSNTGVLRRRVEVRWRLKPGDFDYYHRLQLGFLLESAPLLRENGILLYSTCSIDSRENQQVVEEFIRRKPEYEILRQETFFPSENGGDGGYMTRLQKR